MVKSVIAARTVLIRYIITNLIILVVPISIAIIYYAVSVSSIEQSVTSIVSLQLKSDVRYIDQKLKYLEEQTNQLLVDFELNRYLNTEGFLDDIEKYNTKRISSKLLSLISGGEFLSRGFIYMEKSDSVILDNGFSGYDLFYGSLFEVEGISSVEWKSVMLHQGSTIPTFLSGFRSSEEGKSHNSHFIIRPIGRGPFRRGSIVTVINAEVLGQRLTQLPKLYGGWLIVTNEVGDLIAASSADTIPPLDKKEFLGNSQRKILINGQPYQMYHQVSSFNGWNYIALLNDKSIRADLIRTRNTALFLLSFGFLLGVVISCFIAFANSRPMVRLFAMLNIGQRGSRIQFATVYTRMEQAIQDFQDTKKQLEKEVRSATLLSQNYFIKSLLHGEYRDRSLFLEDRDRFSVLFLSGGHFILSCRLSPLAQAIDITDADDMLGALLQKLKENIKREEFALSSAQGSLVVILRAAEISHYRTVAASFIERLRRKVLISPMEHIYFGIGTPVKDPFFLPVSFNEAETASLSIDEGQRNPVQYYEDLPASEYTYRYPLHTEQAIYRSIQGSNLSLLQSLVHTIKNENFKLRTLSSQEMQNLISALQGTAHRLMNEFPEELGRFSEETNKVIDVHDYEKAFDSIIDVLVTMAEEREKGKRSRKENLTAEIRKFVLENFQDFNLGLSSIAEKFNLTENYVSNFFKEQEGEGLQNYIQRVRMTEASSILSGHLEIPVDTIASRCGYPNTSSFRRAFKRIYGIAPSDYRDFNKRDMDNNT